MKLPKVSRRCQPAAHLLRIAPCQGPLYEAKGYFVDGQSIYYCEAHAEILMRMNPLGPTYRLAQKEVVHG